MGSYSVFCHRCDDELTFSPEEYSQCVLCLKNICGSCWEFPPYMDLSLIEEYILESLPLYLRPEDICPYCLDLLSNPPQPSLGENPLEPSQSLITEYYPPLEGDVYF